MDTCHCHTEIIFDGSSQLNRYLKALDPSYAPVDGRSLEDLLVFAKRYASQIRFYDIPESKAGDEKDIPKVSWREFFRKDIAVIAASVSVTNLQEFVKEYEEVHLKALEPSPTPLSGHILEKVLIFARKYAAWVRFSDIPHTKIGPTQVSWREFFRRDMAVIAASISVTDLQKLRKEYDEIREQLEHTSTPEIFAALFSPILGIAAQMDRWYSLAIPENPLHGDLDLMIRSSLRDQIHKVIAYDEGFKYIDHKKDLNLDYSAIENVDLWGVNDTVYPDDSIYQGADEAEKLRYAALFVDDIFYSFHTAISRIVEKSDDYLRYALEQYPAHQPHMALFITFLQMYRLAQDQMNTLTESFLNFYYRDVLHLAEKPSIPDRVYIVLELAKDIAEYDLAAGTAMNGGKDASGKEQVYVTKNDFVVNQAKVKELKNIFIEKVVAENASKQAIEVIQSVFARPVANSLDGFGEKITDPSGKWPTFGKPSHAIVPAKNPCDLIAIGKPEINRKDQAKIGFAIASPQLLLQGGNRLLTLSIPGLENILEEWKKAGSTLPPFEIVLTGEKGWLTITHMMQPNDYKQLYFIDHNGNITFSSTTPAASYYIEGNKIILYLPIVEQSIVQFNAKTHPGYTFQTEQPIMQVLLNEHVHLSAKAYNDIAIHAMSLDVHVGSVDTTGQGVRHFDGLKKLVIQTENGLFPSDKPFDPFTAYPAIGKSFYIGSREVFNKPLGELTVNLRRTAERKTEPTLQNNNKNNELNSNTTVPPYDYSVSVLEKKAFIPLSTTVGRTEFYIQELSNNILFTPDSSTSTASKLPLDRKPVRDVTEWNASTEKGFIRIDTLRGGTIGGNIGFLQSAQDLAPLLQIKEISISYHSVLTTLEAGIDQFFHVYPFGVVETYIDEVHTSESSTNGTVEIKATALDKKLDKKSGGLLVDAKNLLFPQFTYVSLYSSLQEAQGTGGMIAGKTEVSAKAPAFDYSNVLTYSVGVDSGHGINQYSGDIQEQGLLYIGLENLKPLQSVSLLFQFAEGSALDEDQDPPHIHWSYLSNNEWKPLKGEHLVSDSTYGFQTTGIVKIDVPADATSHNTIITDGLIWFSASVTEHSERIPQLVGVVAQAVEAAFDDRGNAQSHFDKPLPAGSISKLAVAVNEISKVKQPYATFDGKHREIGKEFYTRVSERLRHKGRAVTAWDYEHLVLDRFPSIYKVKCITHSDPECLCRHTELLVATEAARFREKRFASKSGLASGEHEPKAECCGPQIAPGHVLIVPIANLKNRNAANPLQPKTSRRTLLEIEAYLQKRTSAFVHVHAKNPVYEQIIVAFRVQFYSGTDKGYFLKKLNDEIVHYLTPWAFDENAEVKFGQKVYASSIIQFIEQRPYVDFITDFFMGVCRDECCPEHGAHKHELPAQHNQPQDDIEQIHNCDELHRLMKEKNKFKGETIAVPSGPRSILVSVPQHVIIPYEEPIYLSPCERRKGKTMIAPSPVAPPIPDPPVPAPAPSSGLVPPAPASAPAPLSVNPAKKDEKKESALSTEKEDAGVPQRREEQPSVLKKIEDKNDRVSSEEKPVVGKAARKTVKKKTDT